MLPVMLIISLIGLVFQRRHGRSPVPLLGVLGLLLLSWPPVDWLLSRPLEAWYPLHAFPAGQSQAIVVLSAGVDPPIAVRPYPLPDPETYARSEFAAWLYGHWHPLPVLACGGSARQGEHPVSQTMRELVLRAGVPASMVWTEERSHSTHENAVYGAEILRQHGIGTIALVVDAQSMLRAEASFRQQGINVRPAPSNFREFGPLSEELLPSWVAIHRNELTLHEVLGLAWYRMHGWI